MDQVPHRKIRIIDNVYIIKLLKLCPEKVGQIGEVKGALGIDVKKNKIVIFESKSVVLSALVVIPGSTHQVILECLKITEKA
jgi:succinate dehydrogenase/fumarate reductase flavoprotein subunit